MLKNVLKVLCCLAVLAMVPAVQAQEAVVPVQLPADYQVIQVGDDIGIQGGVIYDNTTDSGFYFPPPAGAFANGVFVADDVILPGTGAHINSMMFGYATNSAGPADATINFYGTLNPDGSGGADPASIVATITVTGLPGSPDGSITAFTVGVDLAGAAADFDWASNQLADGTNINWLGFQFTDGAYGLLTATGGNSRDVFWTDTDLNPPFGPGSFLWFFGGSPQASFHIQLSGAAL